MLINYVKCVTILDATSAFIPKFFLLGKED